MNVFFSSNQQRNKEYIATQKYVLCIYNALTYKEYKIM